VLWLRFHQNDVPARGEHRIQLYLPTDRFAALSQASEARLAAFMAERERKAREEERRRG